MLISEIFYSIQGEGSLVGVPSVFVRTSGCNLRCAWCDTPYASWQPDGRELSINAIVNEVRQFPARHVVVTGGEPMIMRDIAELLLALKTEGLHITIETAGTVPPENVVCDLASISPKLGHSTPEAARAGAAWVERHERTRWQPDVVRQWCEHFDHQLKFVVASEADLAEIRGMLDEIGVDVGPHRVSLMPEGTSVEAMRQRYSLLIDACKTNGWRFSPRLHLELFGNKRGT